MNSKNRRSAEKRGRRAEFLAAFALICKGYRIRAMRYRCRGGEVDIIARKGDLVALVEVKARKSLAAAHDAVGVKAAGRIETAGLKWIAQQPDAARLSYRLDLMAVLPWRWPVHVQDIF